MTFERSTAKVTLKYTIPRIYAERLCTNQMKNMIKINLYLSSFDTPIGNYGNQKKLDS